MGSPDIKQLVEVFRCLGDPTRLKIYKLLTLREFCVCELAAVIGVTESCVSQHLRRLKAVALVNERREKQWVFYSAELPRLRVLVRATERFLELPLEAIPDLYPEMEGIVGQDPAAACARRSNEKPVAALAARSASD